MNSWEGLEGFAGPANPALATRVEESQQPSTDDVLDPKLLLLQDFEKFARALQWDDINTQLETTADKITPPVSPPLPIELSSEKDFLNDTVDEMELKDFFAKSLQGTEWDASVSVQPSPKKRRVLHGQPTTSKNTSASSCVPQSIEHDSPLIHDSRLNHLGTFRSAQELQTSATSNAAPRKRKRDDTEGRPHIKKPPNAFMLFRAEQRQNVVDELHIRDSAKVNTVLGQRWKMLSEQEQAPYYEQAHRVRRAHQAKYNGSANGIVANDDPLSHNSRLNHLGTFSFGQELDTCAVPHNNEASSKRKLDDTEDVPYIKKPLNAFMLFRAEQRQNVVDKFHITDSAQVNTVLGQRWKMLSEQEKAPYYERAYEEKRAHAAKYPGWTAKDNFGKNSKRRKTDSIPVAPNTHNFAVHVAPVYQPPVMMLPNQTVPLNVPIQAPNNQAPLHQAGYSWTPDDVNTQAPTQELPMQSLAVNGIPTPAILLDSFFNMSPEHQQASVHYLLNHPAP